jgi:ABC-type antimicrobial peptide transport system permease subunit
MNTTSAYVINTILVLLVVRQIREHRMDLRGLAGPVLAVGAAAVFFLRSVPAAGNDLLLELACVAAGAVMGCLSGLFTHLRRDGGGQVLGRAGWVSAGLWVAGVGARMVFVFAVTHGLGPAIGRFSVVHHITSAQAWAAALVMMALADVLARLTVLFVRGRRLAVIPAAVPSPACIGIHA